MRFRKPLQFSWLACFLGLGILLTVPIARGEPGGEFKTLWAALKNGGHIGLMRHAEAPGTGDPENFRLADCNTQRQLSEAGREQARRIGRAFRERGVRVERILSSRWCRCRETAQLLGLGPVEPFPALDSFFQNRNSGPAQTAELRRFVSERRGGASLVLVTHQVNITALTGVFPGAGDIVVIRAEDSERGVAVLGVIPGSHGGHQ